MAADNTFAYARRDGPEDAPATRSRSLRRAYIQLQQILGGSALFARSRRATGAAVALRRYPRIRAELHFPEKRPFLLRTVAFAYTDAKSRRSRRFFCPKKSYKDQTAAEFPSTTPTRSFLSARPALALRRAPRTQHEPRARTQGCARARASRGNLWQGWCRQTPRAKAHPAMHPANDAIAAKTTATYLCA